MNHHLVTAGFPLTSDRAALGWGTVVLVETDGVRLLVDCGFQGDRPLVLSRLAELGCRPEDIDLVFLTHFHYDHVLNVDLFTRARFLMSRIEHDYVARSGWREANDPYVPAWLLGHIVDRLDLIEDSREILPGLTALALPGHTPGLTGLLMQDSKTLIASDGVKNGWELVHNVPPPCFHSPEAALAGYEKARSTAEAIIPGHDRPFRLLKDNGIEYTGAQSAVINYYGDPWSDQPTRFNINGPQRG